MFGSDLFLFLSVRDKRDEFSYLQLHTTLTESEMPTFLDTLERVWTSRCRASLFLRSCVWVPLPNRPLDLK